MRVQAFALLASATTAIAAETVTLFMPGFDDQEIVGKVIGTNGPKTTSYLINCPGSSDSDECGIPAGGITVVQGSSSAEILYSMARISVAQSCSYDSVSVSCGATLDENGLTSTITTAAPMTELPFAMLPVTITATETSGASATTGASVSASTATSTSTATLTTSASATGTTATGTQTATGSDSSSAAATSQTETGNAAMPMMTGNARWAAGGVAAALALAAF